MATVLVTGAGGAGGVGAIESLCAETDHRVVGVDMNPAAAGIQLAHDGEAVPAATDDRWPGAVADAVTRHGVDVVVPTVDEELSELRALSRALPDGVPVVAPRRPVVETALDKWETHRRLRSAGHEVPRTVLGTEAETLPESAFPAVVKPRRGRGSRGVTGVADPDALRTHLSETDRDPGDLIVQQRVRGTEFTTSVVGTRDGRLLAVVPKEAIEKQGSTTLGATRRAPAVASSCRGLFETLSPAGPMNVQQIVGDDGTPYTIEINPRFSSTSCLTVAAGVDEFDLLVRDALGESVAPPDDYVADRYLIRYDGHLFADDVTLDRN